MMKGTDSNPGVMLCKAVTEYGIHMIVVGRRPLGGVQRFFAGSTSKYLVENADCTVIVVKVYILCLLSFPVASSEPRSRSAHYRAPTNESQSPVGAEEEHADKKKAILAEEEERIVRQELAAATAEEHANKKAVLAAEEEERKRRLAEVFCLTKHALTLAGCDVLERAPRQGVPRVQVQGRN